MRRKTIQSNFYEEYFELAYSSKTKNEDDISPQFNNLYTKLIKLNPRRSLVLEESCDVTKHCLKIRIDSLK